MVAVTPLVGLGTWHFNGKSWTKITGQGRNIAQASAFSASNIWGIGGYHTAYPQVDHYNGTAWRAVSFPAALGTPRYILAVSAHEVWLAGENNTTSPAHPVLIRWHGSTWRQVTVPAPVASVLGSISTDGHRGIWIKAQKHRTDPGMAAAQVGIRQLGKEHAALRILGQWPRSAAGHDLHVGCRGLFQRQRGTGAIWAHGPVG